MLFQSYTKKDPHNKQFKYQFLYEENEYEIDIKEDTIVIDLEFSELKNEDF